MKRQLLLQTVIGVEVSYSVSTPVVSRSQCLSPQFITHPININTPVTAFHTPNYQHTHFQTQTTGKYLSVGSAIRHV